LRNRRRLEVFEGDAARARRCEAGIARGQIDELGTGRISSPIARHTCRGIGSQRTANTPRARRMDGLFHWLITARSLRTLAEVQRMAKWPSASVVGPVLPARLGRLTPMAPAVDGRGEFARAFTSPLRRAFRTCGPRRLRRVDRVPRT
jgi:hypothetical protein